MSNKQYPMLNRNFVLVKQYDESLIYPLGDRNNQRTASSSYEYEYMTKSACDVLSRCTGQLDVGKIFKQIKDIYPKATQDEVQGFIDGSIKKGYLDICDNPSTDYEPKIYGSYDLYSPIRATFEITKSCPLRCIHCLNYSGQKRDDELTLSEIKQVIDTFVKLGIRKIMITGGEPTSRPDFLDILDYASDKFTAISIASNGYLIDDALADQIAKYKDKIAVQISLDGSKTTHDKIRGVEGSYEKALFAMRRLSQRGVGLLAAATLNGENFSEMDEIARAAYGNGVRQLNFGMTFYLGRAKEGLDIKIDVKKLTEKALAIKSEYALRGMFAAVEEETERITHTSKPQENCGAGVTSICVRENGDVAPCISFNYRIGNIIRDDLKSLFSPSRAKRFLDYSVDVGACLTCEKCDLCYGCKAFAYELEYEGCSWYDLFSKEHGGPQKAFTNGA